MAYCTFCSHLIERIVTPSPLRPFETWESEKDCDFRDSMSQCALCKFLYQSLDVVFGEQSSNLDRGGMLRKIRLIKCYGYRNRNGILDTHLCRVHLIFLSIYDPPYAYFAVWAEMGDPAAATMTTQPPIHKDESETDQICALVRKRLYDCITTHPECGQSNISGTEAKLPTRVLYVKNATSYHESIKLVQTDGATGAYCALSHCWGPVDRQPIRTLAENIQDHYSGIPLTALPRTFQEAVILTQRLGIDYLWIDSLCIQQDDDDDWRREAASMGQLYQQATLVIAASGSKDPTGGLFICERSPKVPLKLPYAGNGKTDGGTFNIMLRRPSARYLDLRANPLQERAWALQESYLSRRIVLFRYFGIDWRCMSCQFDEDGCSEDLGLYEHNDWFSLLTLYSRRKLTRPSDRLPALQGIVNEEGKRRDDTFLSEGVWENEIPEHLLWYRESILAHDNFALPSWSWAATEGSKNWICESLGYEIRYDHSCVVVTRSEPDHLSVSGDLVQGKLEWADMKVCCISRCEEYLRGKEGPRVYLAQTHLLKSDDGILGFAALDRNEEPSSSVDHSTLEFCILSKMRTSEISEKPGIEFPELYSEPCLDSCIDLWQEFQYLNYVLWALVLEPVADTKDTYIRVGLAMFFPRVQTAGYCKSACFTLK